MIIIFDCFVIFFNLQFKAIVFVGLIAAANSALLPSRGLSLPRQQYYQPAHVNYQPRNVGPEAQAQILRSDSVVNPESFQYAYDTSNGISGQEAGQLKQIGQGAAIVSQGQFSYTSPEGQPIQLSYVADENGFQPSVSWAKCSTHKFLNNNHCPF